MASKKTIEIVKTTVPVLEEHGAMITKVFYRRLFKNHPELQNIFNMTHQKKGTQSRALANAIFQYACCMDRPEQLESIMEAIVQKHVGLSVLADMYPLVGKNLLDAIKEVLGDAATPEIMEAWAEAYGDLASVLIKREEAVYASREKAKGGFRGEREFVVVRKVKESEAISSFYLKRKDGSPVPRFLPGQYISLTLDIPGTSHQHTRNYSLSDSRYKDYLRISVKKERGNPDGVVSNYLHSEIHPGDVLTIGMPSGAFVLKESKKPLVLISGGVGITPLMSMYKETMATSDRPVYFIQCALNSAMHAFKGEINKGLKNIARSVIIYNQPLHTDIPGKDYHFKGYFTSDVLKTLGISNQSDFYFCGPEPFMQSVLHILNAFGVHPENINFEFFGPAKRLA